MSSKIIPVPSGAHLAPDCDRGDCGGYRSYDTPAGKVPGHCWCPTGRRAAEKDYAERHDSRPPPVVAA